MAPLDQACTSIRGVLIVQCRPYHLILPCQPWGRRKKNSTVDVLKPLPHNPPPPPSRAQMIGIIPKRNLGNRVGGGGGVHDAKSYPHDCFDCRCVGGEITSQRLLDQSQVGMHVGENTTYPPFWAYSRTLPQGVELNCFF